MPPPPARSDRLSGRRREPARRLRSGDDRAGRADAAGRVALAKPFVEQKYRTEWVGTASGKNYWEKWREAWNAAHPGRN